MWIYEKRLQKQVSVDGKNPKLAEYILTQFGGPDGELSAAIRYLTQRYTMPTGYTKALLTDIGTEELAHWEMIATMVYQLTDGLDPEAYKQMDMAKKYAQRGPAVFPTDSEGNPWTAAYIQAHGNDPVANLQEDLAAESKARATYENLLDLSDDEKLNRGLRFLREREVVHFQRFGEALNQIQEEKHQRRVFY